MYKRYWNIFVDVALFCGCEHTRSSNSKLVKMQRFENIYITHKL